MPPHTDDRPGLELLITLASDDRTLSFTLHSPDGDYNFMPLGSVTLRAPPRERFQRLFDRLSILAHRQLPEPTHSEQKRVVQQLDYEGSRLYQEVFSPEFRREYPALRNKYLGAKLVITTNDPWIPWEIVRPVASDRRFGLYYNDPPLCEGFQLSRWVPGLAATKQLKFRNAVVVQPDFDLPAARTERDYFAALRGTNQDLVAVTSPLHTVDDTLSSFGAGQTTLYHFACHGNFDLIDPDGDSVLRLSDGYLTPSDITGELCNQGLLNAQPLIFVNACQSGKREVSLSRLGGWVDRFVEAGASAFIGSLWDINDDLASLFTVEFYNRLLGLGGCPRLSLAEAFRQARMMIKTANRANSTWLGYVLYGDPDARVDFPNDFGYMRERPSTPEILPLRERGDARRLRDWLEHWQFTKTPFTPWDAEQETSPEPALFVDRPYIERVRGDPANPVSTVLLGPAGAGKTAAREAIWNDCTSGQVRAFPIRYTHFDFLLGLVEKDPTRLQAYHHVKAILRSGLRTLAHDMPTSFFAQLSPEDKAILQSMSRAFAGPTSYERLARLAPAPASEIEWEAEEPAEILRALVELVTHPDSTGKRRFEAIYVLVDRIEAPPGGAKGALPLLRSLLLSDDLLDVPRVAFKLFLRPTIDRQLLVGSGVRRSRFVRERIEWDADNLVELVGRRLKTFSNFNVGSIDQLCSAKAKSRVTELWLDHNRSPRELLMRLDRMLRFHLEHTGGPYFEPADILSVLPTRKQT